MNLFAGCTGRSLANGLAWLHEPPEWRFDENRLTIVPQSLTDLFRPYDGTPSDNACLLYREVTGDFTAATRAKATIAGFGDAAAIAVRASDVQWAKLCLERSPLGEASAVSVVTDRWSDDANGELLDRPECYLRLTRRGNVFGMHYGLDGATWRFVRTFGFELPPTVKVGVLAQAPNQGGWRAVFGTLELTPEAVKDFRSGK